YLNTGSKTSPTWTSTPSFVSGIETTTYWKVPSLVDIDGDGDLDLVYGTSDGTLFCYKNNGTKISPVFQYDPSYFQVIRIDGGSATVSFADYDNDGDMDFISGDWLGKIQLFRNDGTKSAPKYTRVTTNYGGIDVGSYSCPVFVDLDSDGDLDIVSGELNGKLLYYVNNGGVYTSNTTIFAGITVAGFSSPAFADLNGDLGAETADNIRAYLNMNGVFIRNDSLITGIDHFSKARPAFVDIDKDGDYDLLLGTSRGAVHFFQNIGSRTWPVWQRADELFNDVGVRQDAAPAFADLDGDGKSDLVIGEYNGNFSCYKNSIPMSIAGTTGTFPKQVLLHQNYPNPFNPATTISFVLPSQSNVRMTVYSALGREVALLVNKTMPAGSHCVRWDASECPSGAYYYRIEAGAASVAGQMVLVK
ncbi:MAG: FG-GAP-like repeat-containing protein, partial [Ignavibacteriales bacterium]|nr:FG-GAP-like repeat-containing protein [Ignavibacteriales bacterium]